MTTEETIKAANERIVELLRRARALPWYAVRAKQMYLQEAMHIQAWLLPMQMREAFRKGMEEGKPLYKHLSEKSND